MRGLLYKNLFTYRAELILIGVLQLIVSGIVLFVSATTKCLPQQLIECLMLFFCIFLMSGLFEYQLFLPDEEKAVCNFIFSIPGGPKSQVGSKYLTLFIANAAILLCCFITDVIACGICGSFEHLSLPIITLFFSISLIFAAYSTPFYLRFGMVAGNSAKYGAIGVLALVFGVYALFGDISFLDGNKFAEMLSKLMTKVTVTRIITVALPLAVLLYFASYGISLALYKKGADRFDK